MAIIAKKANPAEIDTPASGKVSLYVDCCDGKIKVKDSNGCVNTLSYAGAAICNMYVDVLIVGGGGSSYYGNPGAGGYSYGGGAGGGGGVCECCYLCLSNTEYNIVVGCGGTQTGTINTCFHGCPSCFGDICVKGGCGGGLAVPGCSGNGYAAGSNYCYCGSFYNGGAGGAGGTGRYSYYTDRAGGYRGGDGGDGYMSCISGTKNRYGGGGAGYPAMCNGTFCWCPKGGCGGGGDIYQDGQYYGGGAGGNSCMQGGHSGYQGIVIVRYKTDGSMGVKCATGGTITCCDGYTIHTFTDTTQTQTFCITCTVPFYPVVQ